MIAFTELERAATRAPIITLEELTGAGDVLVLAPHPDDESLAMGGAISKAVASGRRVNVAIVTDGAQSHPNSRSHPPAVLAALRREEAKTAVAILTEGQSTPIWLGYPDLAAPEHEEDFETVARSLRQVTPGASALWTTWGGDPHPDHQRVWRLAQYLAEKHPGMRVFGAPLWSRVQPLVMQVPLEKLRRFPAGKGDVKARAVHAHRSQMTDLIKDDPEGFTMSKELSGHFIETDEVFISA